MKSNFTHDSITSNTNNTAANLPSSSVTKKSSWDSESGIRSGAFVAGVRSAQATKNSQYFSNQLQHKKPSEYL